MLLAEAERERLDSKHHSPDSTQHPRTHTNDRPRISRIRRRSRRRGSAGPGSSAGGATGRSGPRGGASDRDDCRAGPSARDRARGSSCTSRTGGGRHARSGSHARSRGLNTGARGGEGGSGGVCECGSGDSRAPDDGCGAGVGSGLGDSSGTSTSLARSSPGMISTEIQGGLGGWWDRLRL